ncbi:hypothetical protein D3C72_2415380 [compost metagenome]
MDASELILLSEAGRKIGLDLFARAVPVFAARIAGHILPVFAWQLTGTHPFVTGTAKSV